MKIDAHQHFWRYDRAQYGWIPPGSPLARSWLPADLAAIHERVGFHGSIAVQARQSVAESDWLLGLADADPRIVGVVGWVDLRDPQVGVTLERLAAHPRFVGVRHVVQDEPADDFLVQPDFVRGLRQLSRNSLTYDLLIYPRQLPAAIELARLLPEQPFVLDHIAKPAVKAGSMHPWADQIRTLAQCPNVHCKLSGLVTEADHNAWRAADLRPYLEVVAEAFRPRRLMFGSDWPVCLFAASYERVLELITDFAAGFPEEDRAALFGTNALEFYGPGDPDRPATPGQPPSRR